MLKQLVRLFSLYNRSSYNVANNTTVAAWSTTEQTYLEAPYGTPIAVCSSDANASAGQVDWIQLLSVSSAGIQVDTWTGAKTTWTVHKTHPSIMSNSSNNEIEYRAVAMIAMGAGYGAVLLANGTRGIESWQVADDYVDWTSAGWVDIGDAWS